MQKPLFLILFSLLIGCSSTPDPRLKKAELYYNQGTKELVNKSYTRALKYLLLAVNQNPKSSKTHNNLGMVYYFKGNSSIAIKHLKTAYELDEENMDALNNLATVYMNSDKYEMAEKMYLKISQNLLYEAQQRIFHNLGVVKLKQNKRDEALKYFAKAVKVDEYFCPSYFKMGEIAFQSGRYQAALEKFKEANQGVCFQDPKPQYYEALSMIELKDYTSAKVRLENLVERFPKHDQAQLFNRKLLFIDQMQAKGGQVRHNRTGNKGQNFSPNL